MSQGIDPETPLEETMGALDHIVRSGKALYAGISIYNSQRTKEAVAILKDLGTPCLIHQPSYNMLNRWVEDDDAFRLFACTPGVGSNFLSKKPDFEKIAKYLHACQKFHDHLKDGYQAEGLSLFMELYIRGDIDFDEIELALIWSKMAMDNGEYLVELGQNWLN